MPMDWTPPPSGGRRDADLGKVVEYLKSRMPNLKRPRGLWLLVLIVAAIILGSSAYYTVGPDETGVVLRFGRFVRQTGPGLHFKLPLGIEKAIQVKTGRVQKEEFGFRGIGAGVRSRFDTEGYDIESLMLTGDLNVIDVKWIVQYRIRDPQKWLFKVRNGRSAIRDLSESVVRRIVGNSYSDLVLTRERSEIAVRAQKELQRLLDSYNTGVQVVTVKLQDVNPPKPVRPSYNEVNEARQQRERMINEAQEAYNRRIPTALGQAKRMITEAEGYATERVNRARGEAERFDKVLAAYRQAKEVTLRRFYLEAMAQVLQRAAKVYLVDEKVKGFLPHLNLKGNQMGGEVKQ